MITSFNSTVSIEGRSKVADLNVIGTASVTVESSNISTQVSFCLTFKKNYGKRLMNVEIENIMTHEVQNVTITHSGMIGKKLDTTLYNLLAGYIQLDYVSFRNLLTPVLAQAKEAFSMHCIDEQNFIIALSMFHASA